MDLITRSGWGARPWREPNGSIRFAGTPAGVKVHYLGTSYADRKHSKCAAYIRAVQNSHMDRNGWSDIAYNFLVCTHGTVYEGRGLHRRNSANGNTHLNENHYAVCALLGSTGRTTPTTAQLHGLRDAIEYCRKQGGAGSQIRGHRDGYATQCPGDALDAWVTAGAPRPANSKPGAGRRTYTVRAGDTLSQIATRYHGVSWQQIASANAVRSPYTIYPGQRLTIPTPTKKKAYSPPPFPAGLRPGSTSPSARPWQRCLKALGLMPKTVTESDHYGPQTQAATARFHDRYPQFKSRGVTRDVAVGPKGWAHAHRIAYGGK